MYGLWRFASARTDKTSMSDTVILADGDLPGLVCACLAAEQSPIALLPASRTGELTEPAELARRAIEAQGDLLGAELLTLPHTPSEPTALLVVAAILTANTGAGRLVSPVIGVDLAGAAREADRALLVQRLIGLDADGPGPAIETPLVDLTDEQVAELAVDVDVPVWRCWWWQALRGGAGVEQKTREIAVASRDRWTTALRACGWTEATEHASIPSG